MNGYYIKLTNINFQKISETLIKMGYIQDYMSDFNFCPYLIITKNKNILSFNNINEGYLNSLKEHLNIKECLSADDFIDAAYKLKSVNNTNSLF